MIYIILVLVYAAYIFFEIFDMIMEKKKGPAAEEE